MADELWEIVGGLIVSDAKAVRRLSRGLVLAFTPQPSDSYPGAGAKLTWSRRGAHPSEVEDKIVEVACKKSLRMGDKMALVGGPTFRTGLTIIKGWGSSQLTWRWVETRNVWNLPEPDRTRALQWINNEQNKYSL